MYYECIISVFFFNHYNRFNRYVHTQKKTTTDHDIFLYFMYFQYLSRFKSQPGSKFILLYCFHSLFICYLALLLIGPEPGPE